MKRTSLQPPSSTQPATPRAASEVTESSPRCAATVLIARVDGDVSGRNLAEHLQHLAERGVVRRVLDRLPAHGERRAGEPHPSLERADRGRQGLRPVAAGVEDVRQRGRVDRIESLPECGGPFHSASVSFTVALNAT